MSILLDRTWDVDLLAPVTPRPLRDVLLCGDRSAHRLHVQLHRGGESVTGITGVTGCFLRADGASVIMTGETEAGGVQLVLAPACYEVPGRGSLLVRVSEGDSIVTALWLEVSVAGTASETIIDGDDVVPTLDDLLSRLAQMEQATREAQDAAASLDACRAMVQLPVSWETGYRIDYQTGLPTVDSQYAATAPIGMAGGYVAQVDILTAAASDSSGYAFYDAEGLVLSCGNIYEGTGLTLAHHVLDVPPAARSLRFSSRVKNNLYQQAAATIPTAYGDVLTAARRHADDALASREEVALLEERLLRSGWHETGPVSGLWTLRAGCYVDGSGALLEDATFDTYLLTPAHPFRLYAAAAQLPASKYVSLAVYTGAADAEHFRARYRSYKTENTMPTADAPLQVTSALVLALSVHAGEDFALMSDDPLEAPSLSSGLRLGENQLEQVRDSLSGPLGTVRTLEQALVIPGGDAELTDGQSLWTSRPGCYADGKGSLVLSEAFDSYVHTAQCDFRLWADDPDADHYLSLAVYGDSEAVPDGFLARYRCYKSENTLPASDAPLQVKAGQTLCVTVAAGADFRLLSDYALAQVRLAEGVVLGGTQLAQIAAQLPRTGPVLPLESTGDSVTLLLPTDRAGTSIRCTLVHISDTALHADCWRLGAADAVADGEVLFPLVSDGEWEMALMLQGRPDFIGGKQHGSEMMTRAAFTVNGVRWVPGEDAESCRELGLRETTTLYDPADETLPVGIHERVYTISAEGIRIAQRVRWLVDAVCDYSYVCMLPILRGHDAVTPHLITGECWDDRDFTVYDISSPGFSGRPHLKAHGMTRYFLRSRETGVEAEVTCRITNEPESSVSFVQNTADLYNKVYFSYCGPGYAVTAGDEWAWEQHYRLNIACRAGDRADEALHRLSALEERTAALEESRAAALLETTAPAPVALCWPETDSALLPRAVLSAHQAGGGAASPDNVRPLSGAETAVLCRTGRNRFCPAFAPDGDTGTLARFDLPGVPGETCTVSTDVPGTEVASVFVSVGGPPLPVTCAAPRTVTVPEGGTLSVLLRHDTAPGGVDARTGVLDGTWQVQVEPGGTATALSPFGTAREVALGETCWGGVLDWATGTLTVTHGGCVLTGAETLSPEGSGGGVYRYAVLNVAKPTVVAGHGGLFSHGSYSRSAYAGLTALHSAYAANGHLYLLSDLSTPEALAAWLRAQAAAGTPVTAVYELAAPVTRALTLPGVRAVTGLNQLFLRGGGDVSVTHHADLTHLIALLRAAVGV